MLRCRFDTVAQARVHLHVRDKSALLFFRRPDLVLAEGAAVLVELAFRDTDQTRLMRGVHRGVVLGQGCWLEFPSALVSAEVETGLLARRQHRRFGADLPVELLAGDRALPARLLDASLVGARLLCDELGLRPGARVSLRPNGDGRVPDRVGPAVVVWSNRSSAGLYFDRGDATCRAAVGTLHAALQQAWQSAPEAAHLRSCCQAGHVIEPPFP